MLSQDTLPTAGHEFNRLYDRCDRCGAQAAYAAVLNNSKLLMFCAHHFNDHSAKLLEDGWTFVFNEAADGE